MRDEVQEIRWGGAPTACLVTEEDEMAMSALHEDSTPRSAGSFHRQSDEVNRQSLAWPWAFFY
jgi:hypothetical protein